MPFNLAVYFCLGLASFGPDDVVIEAFSENNQPMAQSLVVDWGPNKGTFKRRVWSMDKGGWGSTKQYELERSGRLQHLKSPGGEHGIWADSWYRMQLINLAMSESPDAPPPKTPPLKKKKRPTRPRTQAELDGLARGRETMRARRAAEASSS
jgi:hypothetical protein